MTVLAGAGSPGAGSPGVAPAGAAAATGSADLTAQEPMLRVVTGHPDDAELAAVLTVLTGLLDSGATPPAVSERSGSGWASRSRLLREPVNPDAGWRGSAAPR